MKKSSKKALSDITIPEVNKEIKEAPVESRILSDKVQNQTKDEYNVEVILDYDGQVDILHLNKKDPEYVYRYLNTDKTNLAVKTSNLVKEKGGWQIVPKDHLIKLGIKDAQLSPFGDYRVGADLVLARIPKHLYEIKNKKKQEDAIRPMAGINRMLKDGDSSVAGIGHEAMKGIQTKDDLKGNWKD